MGTWDLLLTVLRACFLLQDNLQQPLHLFPRPRERGCPAGGHADVWGLSLSLRKDVRSTRKHKYGQRGRRWLQEQQKQHRTLLTLGTTGSLHTPLRSLATCTRRVRREGGCAGAPRGTNCKKKQDDKGVSLPPRTSSPV